MPITSNFLSFTQEKFTPYQPESGTEHIAFLLYSIARMQRPVVSVEYGSGYSTLFLLQALLDNMEDYKKEEAALRKKASQLGDLDSFDLDDSETATKINQFYGKEGRACNVNPKHYLEPHQPVLYSFENCDENTAYVSQMKEAVDKLGFSDIFKLSAGSTFSAQMFKEQELSIDLAWNDGKDYERFFDEFWPLLNGNGGLMIFHNVSAVENWWKAIEYIKQHQATANDLEFLLLEEQHKLIQNSCMIFRKTTDYQLGFVRNQKNAVFQSLKAFMR